MARRRTGARTRLPIISTDSLRAPPDLPDAAAVLRLGLPLSEAESTVIRMAMALHTASKQPKLTWNGWKHIAVALAIGSEHAKKASRGAMDTPLYRGPMTKFLRATGFIFLNKDDRAAAVRLLDRWDEIDQWRSRLPLARQQALNNPREVWAAYQEHRRTIGDPEARRRPSERRRRQFPSFLEQIEALEEARQGAEERAEAAERQSEYFAEMMQAIATEANLSDDDIARIRAKVRAAHEADEAIEPEDPDE